MEPRFTDDFERKEFFGREALKELKKIYPEFFKYELRFNTDKFGCYDSFYFIIDDKTQSIIKRVWIEIKIRTNIYDEYILEKKKLKSLIKNREDLYMNEDDVIFLYINFTPNETIIWDISKIDPNDTKKLKANKATSESRTNKVNKDVIYLNPSEGKRLKYIINERQLVLKYNECYLIPKVNEKIRKNRGLDDVLFG